MPTVYRGKALEWEYGNRLINFDGVTFAYDYSGHRLKKNDIEYRYDNDGRVIKQSNGLLFLYDNTGVCSFIKASHAYFYRKDAQGNIIAIIDSSGTVVVRYEYDAWGNHKIIGDETLGNLNPFRYRGYYYDTETGLYYLQTRYYDPITGRFISQDSVEYADPETINGLNLYAYCGNNPVMRVDPTGTLFLSLLIAALVGAAISSLVSIGTQLATTGEVNWGQVGISALFGAVSGMLSFTGIGGVVGQFVIQGALAVGEMYSIAGLNGTVSSIGFAEVAATFLFAGVLSAFGSKGAVAEFRRIGQIESSFIKYAIRDIKNGMHVIGTLVKRGSKYLNKFLLPLVKQSFVTGGITGTANVMDFWIQKYYNYIK